MTRPTLADVAAQAGVSQATVVDEDARGRGRLERWKRGTLR
jgi:hypothetical protein